MLPEMFISEMVRCGGLPCLPLHKLMECSHRLDKGGNLIRKCLKNKAFNNCRPEQKKQRQALALGFTVDKNNLIIYTHSFPQSHGISAGTRC